MKIKQLINWILGKVPKETHRVSWRRKITIDGIFWERVHFPLEKREANGSNI